MHCLELGGHSDGNMFATARKRPETNSKAMDTRAKDKTQSRGFGQDMGF